MQLPAHLFRHQIQEPLKKNLIGLWTSLKLILPSKLDSSKYTVYILTRGIDDEFNVRKTDTEKHKMKQEIPLI